MLSNTCVTKSLIQIRMLERIWKQAWVVSHFSSLLYFIYIEAMLNTLHSSTLSVHLTRMNCYSLLYNCIRLCHPITNINLVSIIFYSNSISCFLCIMCTHCNWHLFLYCEIAQPHPAVTITKTICSNKKRYCTFMYAFVLTNCNSYSYSYNRHAMNYLSYVHDESASN
jgi:hypothetical protein